MESQDGIPVRPMRLKVLYTFDNENKTVCLARWPHLLDIQTAYLDEETQIGVIELRTCIQAIVLASPELVAKLGRDYTIYAYDYSEYETPLVGQGMLSWVLASASPTPNAPAHQSKTIVTGRVCKNVMGLFSRGAQETLEVKLRLVPVPTVLQSEYLNNMKKYRDLCNVITQDFDAQAWANFVQTNSNLLSGGNALQPRDRPASPMDCSGIERFHELLSESSTPREFPSIPQATEPLHAHSPGELTHAAPSRTSTPGLRPASRQQKRAATDAFRPSSRASAHDIGSQRQLDPYVGRRGSTISGYGSCDEVPEVPPQKRAKLFRASWPDKSDMNIERQPESLRVAASAAASVRIHRPTPMHPSALPQGSHEDPARPPTPIPRMGAAISRQARPVQSSLRCESSSNSKTSCTSPAPLLDDRRAADTAAASPEDIRYGNISDTPFNLPSSPPVMENMYPQTSSPLLPPLPYHDSGFMSGPLESLLDDDNCIGANLDDIDTSFDQPKGTSVSTNPRGQGNTAVASSHLASQTTNPQQGFPTSDGLTNISPRDSAPPLPPQPSRLIGSRPSSRASVKPSSKPLAPAPLSKNAIEKHRHIVPGSDPVCAPSNAFHQPQSWRNPMSEFGPTDAPVPSPMEDCKTRTGAGARRTKQVQARLEQCIRQGTVPPYCENCGAIETPTWRRAWSKLIQGNESDANGFSSDPAMLFWQPVDRGEDGTILSFKQFKKTLSNDDKDFVQLLLCNPCGLWLHKFKTMRPENKWNKPPPKDKRKRQTRRTKPPSVAGAATRSRSKVQASKRAESSPGPTEASSPAAEDETALEIENGNGSRNGEDLQPPRSVSRRANSVEPRKSNDNPENRWTEEEAVAALRRAIQSSPARNMEVRNLPFLEPNLTPKSVRRAIFSSPRDKDTKRSLGDVLINGIRRSTRFMSKSPDPFSKENHQPGSGDGLDHLFGTSDYPDIDLEFPGSPTPKQKNLRITPTEGQTPSSAANVGIPTAEESSIGVSSKDENVCSPSRLMGQELERTGKEGSDMDLHACRINESPKDDILQVSSAENCSPQSRKFACIDGLILDMFDSDEESVAQLNSLYPFVSPECPPSGNWADWGPSDYVSVEGSPGGEDSMDQNKYETENDHLLDCNDDSGRKNLLRVADDGFVDDFLQVESHNTELNSIFFSNSNSGLDNRVEDLSQIPDSGPFKSPMVDTQRLNMEDAGAARDDVAAF